MITREQILEANTSGNSYYTPVLQVASLCCDLSNQPVVTGYRFGKAPAMFVSQNHSTGSSEKGLSLAYLEGEKRTIRSEFAYRDDIYQYTGILLPYSGSDGEPLILCFEAENMDE